MSVAPQRMQANPPGDRARDSGQSSPKAVGRLPALIATALAANAFIMTLELVAGRLVARFLGQSLYTWTTIVGAVLLGMSIGSYVGGRLADRYAPLRLLAALLVLAGAACPLVLALNEGIGNFSPIRGLAWPPRIFAHVLATFLVPCIFLGSVTPVILRAALNMRAGTGRVIGLIYGASALGSVLGTFGAGFVLIPNLGTRAIVMYLGLGLGLLAVYYAWIAKNETGAANAAQHRAVEGRPRRVARNGAGFPAALLAVFIANASFMVYELAASRLATQYLGHSIYTWTSLLGVVLAGIMAGNYIGGRLSDRIEPERLLPWLFAAASVTALVSLPVYRWLSESYVLDSLSWSGRIVAQTALAFFVPSMAMGTIGPAAARKAISVSALRGRAVGLVYATGSLASVVATFATGYVLVDHLWPIGTILLLCAVLAGSAVVSGHRSPVAWVCVPPTALAVVLAVMPGTQGVARTLGFVEQSGPEFIYRDHSQYSWIAVTASERKPSVRRLYLDQLLHSTADIEAPLELEYEYEQIYRGVLDAYYPNNMPIRASVLGGGGYVYPRFLELTRPGSYLETVEIDPAVTAAAHAAFGLPKDTSIAIYEMDARNRIEDLVREAEVRFDCVFADSFNQYSVPFQLATLEFNQLVFELLADDGIYFMNLIESMRHGAFLGSVVRTMRQVYPHVYAIRTGTMESVRDTFVVLGSKRALDLATVIATMRREFGFVGDVIDDASIAELVRRNDCPILTDDFAPVDNMVAPLIDTRQSNRAVEVRQKAVEMIESERLEEALPLLESLHQMEPWDLDVVRDLAQLYGRRGELDKAGLYFEKAVQMAPYDYELRYNLGLLYSQTKQDAEALREFEAAYALRPDFAATAFALGSTLNALGRAEEAVEPLRAGTRLEPDNASGHVLLANTLAVLKRYREAQTEFEAALELAPELPGARENLARVFLSLEAYEAAREQYVKLLERDPRNPAILYMFGVTFEAEDRPGEASHYYQLALDIAPDFEQARRALARVEESNREIVLPGGR